MDVNGFAAIDIFPALKPGFRLEVSVRV